MDFEKQLKKLEQMNEEISSGKLGLKKSIETFKAGLKIIEACKKELNQSEADVKKLIGFEAGQAKFELFDKDQ